MQAVSTARNQAYVEGIREAQGYLSRRQVRVGLKEHPRRVIMWTMYSNSPNEVGDKYPLKIIVTSENSCY